MDERPLGDPPTDSLTTLAQAEHARAVRMQTSRAQDPKGK